MADNYGDGWEGTVLGFVTGGVLRYTFTLTNGFVNNSIAYSFAPLAQVTIVVAILGNYTNEISFEVKNAAGTIIAQRSAGSKFFGYSILGTFCMECPSSSLASSSSSSPTPDYHPSS